MIRIRKDRRTSDERSRDGSSKASSRPKLGGIYEAQTFLPSQPLGSIDKYL